MGNQTRRKRKQSRPATERAQRRARSAKIWLTTVSTVVAIATGMFTLRDQVFPHEAGTATAESVAAYQQQVGRVCNEVNSDDRRRAAETETTEKRLKHATTTIAQRNALLDGVRRTTARSGHALASFSAVQPPKSLAPAQRDTEAAWNRNLARLRDYAQRLDQAGTRGTLLAAIGHVSALRTSLSRDGVELSAGLERLGGASCDLVTPRVTPAFTLPRLKGHRASRVPAADTPVPTPRPAPRPQPGATRSGAVTAPEPVTATADASTPAARDVTTPGTRGGVTGGRRPSAGTPGTYGGGAPSVYTPGTYGAPAAGGGGG
jgi:hypothetical protein